MFLRISYHFPMPLLCQTGRFGGLHKRPRKVSHQTNESHLANQLQFLSLVVEDQVVRDPAGEVVGEAAFALLYFQRATDLIPDSIPGMGLLDDAMIVRS